jgi:hypothetical protein
MTTSIREALLREARQFVADSGCDEDDMEINQHRDDLLARMDAALAAPPQDVVEGIAETLWRAEYRRATGKERGIAWDDVAESDQNKYRHSATAILASGLVTATHPDEAAIRADQRKIDAKLADDFDNGRSVYNSAGDYRACHFGRMIAAAIRAGGAK